MGEFVGLALRGTSSCPMEFNLRPPSVVRRHTLAERRPAFVMAGALPARLALGAWWLYYDHAATMPRELWSQGSQPKTLRTEAI